MYNLTPSGNPLRIFTKSSWINGVRARNVDLGLPQSPVARLGSGTARKLGVEFEGASNYVVNRAMEGCTRAESSHAVWYFLYLAFTESQSGNP
jgi:hypothetical protein